MSVTDTLVTLTVLLAIFVLAYVKITNRSLPELVNEIREATRAETEEVILP